MDKLELQKLRDLPIEQVAERLGLQVSRHKCLCPFHNDNHPSLSFHVGRNTFKCFVCDAHGGTIDLVMKYLNKGFLEACEWLGASPKPSPQERALPSGLQSETTSTRTESTPSRGGKGWDFYERFFERPYLSDKAKRFLFDERKIDARVARWCRLTSWTDRNGINWLQIPYYDQDGHLIGIQNRNLDYHKENVANNSSVRGLGGSKASPRGGSLEGALEGTGLRFRFPSGSRCSIYNLPVVNRLCEGEALYITEGCSDCWAMLSSGHKAIAIPSATLLKPSDVKLLSALTSQLSTEFHMYPDRDAPGERLFLQLKERLPNIVHHQLPAGFKDYGEWYASRDANG